MSTASQETHEPVLLRCDDQGVTTVTLNRPNQYNALSEPLIAELQRTLDAIAEDRSVHVVVLAGAGRAFCAGHDLKEMRSNPRKEYYESLFTRYSRIMLSLVQLPQPVIARVHGIATAAGCQLVATCDLAVASNTARFAVSGVNLGLFCSTPGVALSRNIPRKRAFEMLVTGDFIDADTARSYGLINRCVEPDELDEAVRALTDSILNKSPVVVEMGKRLFYQQLESSLETAYEAASDTMACNMMADDAAEGIDAFMAKRKAQWRGR